MIKARLLAEFDSVSIKNIFGESNQEANKLAPMAFGYKVSPKLMKELSEIETNLTPLELRGVCCANALNSNDWRYKIIDFLRNLNQRTIQKIKYLALRFC
ncbi:hypothetical protein AHAS_Ahas09G0077800 [Arachis hypogaea]